LGCPIYDGSGNVAIFSQIHHRVDLNPFEITNGPSVLSDFNMIPMSSASDKKSNFFFANCLHCEGIIRVPIKVRADSIVNCPHCDSRFQLTDFMDQIPEVQVNSGLEFNGNGALSTDEFQIETASGTEQQDGKFVVPPQLAAGIKKRRRRRRRSSESAESATRADANQQISEAEEHRRNRRDERAQKEREKIQLQRENAAVTVDPHKRRTRPAAPKRNPILEGIKILLGGLLAAPIAYLLLMWLFSKDPLGLSPTIYNYAPLLVPESLIFDDLESGPSIEGSGESVDSLRGLPIPETDPDDVDPLKVDLDL